MSKLTFYAKAVHHKEYMCVIEPVVTMVFPKRPGDHDDDERESKRGHIVSIEESLRTHMFITFHFGERYVEFSGSGAKVFSEWGELYMRDDAMTTLRTLCEDVMEREGEKDVYYIVPSARDAFLFLEEIQNLQMQMIENTFVGDETYEHRLIYREANELDVVVTLNLYPATWNVKYALTDFAKPKIINDAIRRIGMGLPFTITDDVVETIYTKTNDNPIWAEILALRLMCTRTYGYYRTETKGRLKQIVKYLIRLGVRPRIEVDSKSLMFRAHFGTYLERRRFEVEWPHTYITAHMHHV